MPTYSFRCPACGVFDRLLPMSRSDEPATCPRCGNPAVRVFGVPALRTLGSGLHRAFDAAAASAENPRVVRRADPGPTRPTVPDRGRYPALPRW